MSLPGGPKGPCHSVELKIHGYQICGILQNLIHIRTNHSLNIIFSYFLQQTKLFLHFHRFLGGPKWAKSVKNWIFLLICKITIFSLRAFRPTQGIVIQKFVCAYDVTNLVPRQNLRTVIDIDLLFFFKDWYEWGVVQSEKKIRKRCEKKVLNCQKRCEIANIEEFPMENLCKPYIFL